MASSPERQLAKQPRSGVGSVSVAVHILEVLSKSSEPLPLKTIAALAGMSAPKAHKYLASFMQGGLVSQAQSGGSYDLGPLALDLGLAAMRRLDVSDVAQPYLDDLRATMQLTSALAVWANFGPSVIRRSDSPDTRSSMVRLGTVLPLLSSAIGLVFVAYLDRRFTEEIVRRELAVPHGPASEAGFRTLADVDSRVAAIRGAGFAFAEGIVDPGRAALACPVFDHTEHLVGVLSVIGIQGKVESASDAPIVDALRQAAQAVSKRMGAPLNRR